jgi:hypothetical protein
MACRARQLQTDQRFEISVALKRPLSGSTLPETSMAKTNWKSTRSGPMARDGIATPGPSNTSAMIRSRMNPCPCARLAVCSFDLQTLAGVELGWQA